MAAIPAVETADIHYQTVSQRVPPHLLQATPEQRQALRAALPAALPWLAASSARYPEVIQALQAEQQRHQAHAKAVSEFLEQLPSAEAFAEPLLRQALKNTFGLDLDVRRTFLFNAARASVDESRINGGDPVANAFQIVKMATQSLLLSALQNFEAFEAEEGGMQDGRRTSLIFTSDTGQILDPSHDVPLLPERFALLCRTLDLGGRYQQLIDTAFRPAPVGGESAEAAASARQAHFKLFEQSSFRLTVHLAFLQGTIDRTLYDDLLQAGEKHDPSGGCSLSLCEVELSGIVLFARGQRVVVYMPEEPQQPLQAFDSLAVFQDSLRLRLKEPAWRAYFMGFIPARERATLMRRIQRILYPRVWNPGGWYEEQFDAQADLRLAMPRISESLFDALLRRRIAQLKDDSLFHAVPTATQDHKSVEDKVRYFLEIGFNALNFAAFAVPVLGQVMLVVNAALLGYEVYEGFDSLAKGEREQAWNYFMDVVENLALMAALGVVGGAQARFTGNLPVAVRSMRPVTLGDGSVRLWKPDLTPFAYDIELPSWLRQGDNGLYHHEGRDWLRLEGRYYSVRTLLGEQPAYVLEHPSRPGAYEPSIRHNGNGGWWHELETPEQWRGMQLFSRLGPFEAEISEAMALRALRISGVSEAHLRQSLLDSRRPPALLSDTLRRLSLEDVLRQLSFEEGEKPAGPSLVQGFALGYERMQAPLSAAGQVVQRQFASLPNAIIEEVITEATPAEAQALGSGRVPLRLAEEVRLYQQQVRIARACEGLYLNVEANLDSARVLLHGLEALPGWPEGLRIGLYDAAPEGPLLTAIGTASGEELALVWRGQLPKDFCQALFDVLPAAARTQLGLEDAAALRRALQEQPMAPRQQLRQWLGMAALKPGFRSPMRLSDGRIGYPLSGQGQPFFTEDELLDKLRLLELDDMHVEDVLQALYRTGLERTAIAARLDGLLDERLQLGEALDRWIMDSATQTLGESHQHSRERIGAALWQHWRSNLLPELGRPETPLHLARVHLADLPAQLPEFFRQRVVSMVLSEVNQRAGAPFERLIREPQLQALAERFTHVTALHIFSGEWQIGLPQMIARTWPQLRGLGLREVGVRELGGLVIGYQDVRALAQLPRLRWLELRGCRLLDWPIPALDGLTLDYLGLEYLGLAAWPQWLDTVALARIGELSLVGNCLAELPPDILDDAEPLAVPMRVALQGNQFNTQALLDLRLAEQVHRRFAFDLNLSATVEADLGLLVEEHSQLQATLQAWVDDSTATTPLTPERHGYRQRVARVLLNFWREDLYLSGTALLHLEDVVLADFPEQLPAFFATRVQRLEMTRFDATTASLEDFLGRFPLLAELSLVAGRPALTQVPASLASLAHLREVALVRMGMTIDQAAMEALGRIPLLTSLQLDGNRLGEITDVSQFQGRFLDYLGLAQMHIAVWPAWLDSLIPHGIELLGLDDNRLTELPGMLLDNHYVDNGATDISLRNNPLSRETMIRAFTSQHANRPYSFSMTLPEDIAAMEARPHSSDSEASETTPEEASQSPEDPFDNWQTGDVEADAQHRLIWQRMATRGDAGSLLALVSRLRQSADYRTASRRAELVTRVWTVLAAADQDTDLRLTLNGMAEEPLIQLHYQDTCLDGIRLEFNQMELQVHTRQALRDVGTENRGATLFRLMRGLFRAQTLDRIARERAGIRDEAEVRLAYRLRWAEQLELPVPPRSMLYRSEAEIAPGELNQALQRLQQEESGQGLLGFAADCDFWSAYLREAFSERFQALREAYEASVLAVVDLWPDESAEQSAPRIRALEDKFKADERSLLEHLTLEQAMAGV